jgi:hypothetical protein
MEAQGWLMLPRPRQRAPIDKRPSLNHLPAIHIYRPSRPALAAPPEGRALHVQPPSRTTIFAALRKHLPGDPDTHKRVTMNGGTDDENR